MSTHARLAICILVTTGTLAGGASSYAGGKGGGGARIGGGSRSMRSIPQGGVKSSLPKVIQGGKTLPTGAQPKIFTQPTTVGTQGLSGKLPTLGQNGLKLPGAGSTAGKLNDQ